ncbi:hypothetical protein ACFFW8_13040 [Erwinia tracheiphila]
MIFTIDGFHLIIAIKGNICAFPNTNAGYKEMAEAWISARLKIMKFNSLAATIEVSHIWRKAYICTALAYRRAGRHEDKKTGIKKQPILKKINSRHFLGPAPF